MNLRTVVAAALVACVLVCTSPVHALQDYADEIQRVLELPDKPSCLFCHARNDRGLATDTLFNRALKSRGFSRRLGLPSLRSAITSLDDMNTDSDRDGVGDIDELRAGANPNDNTDAGLPPPDCSVANTSRGRWISLWLPWLCVIALLSQRAKRRTADNDGMKK